MSEGQGDGAELRDNQPDDPNLNESQHTRSQTPGGPRELISLDNNAEEEEDIGEEGYRGIKGEEEEEDEENDEMMKEEDTASDESSLIRCQSLDTSSTTNDSYSETGSLLETPYPISPGTSPEPTSVASLETPYPISSGNTPEPQASQDIPTASLQHTNPISAGISPEPTCPVTPVVTLGAAYPISPVAQNPCELEVDHTHTCIARPIDSTLTITTTGSTCVTGPINSTLTTPSAAGSACASGPACIGTINFSTDVPCGSGSSCTSAMGPGSWKTADCTTGLSVAPVTQQDMMTGPTTSTSGPISVTVPTSTTGTTPSSALLASLQRLGQIGDDVHLPQYLHQIAEAFALQEDYQSASSCIHLERLYHQRIIDNINTLQGHWESRCRTLVSDQCSQQLNVLTHICQTHERPSAGHILCASLDFRNLSTAEQDRLCDLSSTWIPVRGEIEPVEETHTDSSRSSQAAVGSFTEEETNGNTEEHGNQLTCALESPQMGAAATSVGDHPAHAGEMDPSTPEEVWMGPFLRALQSGGRTEVEGERLEEAVEVNCEEKQKGGLDSSADLGSAPPTQQTMVSENVLSVDDHHGQTQQRDEEDCVEEEEEDNGIENMNLIRESSSLDDLAKLITIEQMSPASGLISILKKRSVCVEEVCVLSTQSHPRPAKRRVHFNVPDDCFEHGEYNVGGGDSCLLLFLLCFVTVVISVGGTALYCALGDTHSSVCQDFSRNTDFYFSQLQHWFTTGSGSV